MFWADLAGQLGRTGGRAWPRFWWACAGANEFVRRTQSAETWAIFRVGAIVAAIVFALAQTPLLMRNGGLASGQPPPDPPEPGY